MSFDDLLFLDNMFSKVSIFKMPPPLPPKKIYSKTVKSWSFFPGLFVAIPSGWEGVVDLRQI